MSGRRLSCLSCHATSAHERNMKFQVSRFKLKTGNLTQLSVELITYEPKLNLEQ